MERAFIKDFYEIQSRQWKKSLFLFLILIIFYFLAIGIIFLAVLFPFSLFLADFSFLSWNAFGRFLFIIALVSLVVAGFHFHDARKFGASFILKRLQARPPDASDRYHKQFSNTVEEIRIAGGLPKVKSYVLPFFAINSMALVESDGTPAVVVTEGLMAGCTRDEIQAVAAHELAHIARGDAFFLTLVCSIANFFERLRNALEPKNEERDRGTAKGSGSGGFPALVYLATTLSSLIIHLLSTLVSREREILADAAAVELGRNPAALARAIYKAHLKNSFVGDFSSLYSPLFIVPPESRDVSEGILGRLFSTHPPLMKRIRLLARMADLNPAEILKQVREIGENRDKARRVVFSSEESRSSSLQSQAFPGPDTAPLNKHWLLRDFRGNWRGPFSLEEMLFLPFFAPFLMVRNLQEGVEALAKEFGEIRDGLSHIRQKKPVDPSRKDRCPRCRLSLEGSFYEGVPVKACPGCRGKLVDMELMGRILARREVGFSKMLMEKAYEFRERFLLNPVKTQKMNPSASHNFFCPNCGYKMIPRPYSYQHFLPVDKCLSCQKIWFDADELEILQILIENPAAV